MKNILKKTDWSSPCCSGFVLKSILALFMGWLTIQGAHAQGVTVSPPRIFFQAEAGTASSQEIHIQNSGNIPLVFATSVKDWERDSLGNKVYDTPGSHPLSNANWIKVIPDQITVPAGTAKDVTVHIQVPANAPVISNSMLFLSQINEQQPVYKKEKDGRSVALNFKLEIGIHLYNTLPSVQVRKDLEFTGFDDLGKVSDSTRLMSLTIHNQGTVITDSQIRLELTNKVTGEELPLNSIPLSMFPGGIQKVRFTVPLHLPKGPYQLAAIMDAGDNSDIKVAKKELRYE